VTYEICALQSRESLGEFHFDNEPILGGLIDEHIIAGFQETESGSKVFLIPRSSTSLEKPFMVLDWHAANVFCLRCALCYPIIIVERIGFCPYLGLLAMDMRCIDMSAVILEFNRIVHKHSCDCDCDCDCDCCDCDCDYRCLLIPQEK
jgi:hypothetical protein